MAIKRASITSLADFATWLQANAVPGLFKSVTYDSETAELSATDADDNTVWRAKNGNSGYFRAYRAASSYIGVDLAAFPNTSGGAVMNCILCDNGLIVDMFVTAGGYGRSFAFMVAKTSHDKLAFIFRSTFDGTANNQYKNAIAHVAWGDSTSITPTTTTFTPEAGQQTILCPWGTNPDNGQTSYTPKAFYMPTGQNYAQGIGKFILGADTYITNGYWAIKDGGGAT